MPEFTNTVPMYPLYLHLNSFVYVSSPTKKRGELCFRKRRRRKGIVDRLYTPVIGPGRKPGNVEFLAIISIIYFVICSSNKGIMI